MNTKLTCLLLDDELPGLQYLKLMCQQIPELEILRSFDSPEKLLAELPKLDFDLLISDIKMPGITGLELAGKLKDKSVIFLTAYDEYAADAFDLNATDYIRKPLKIERLRQAIAKVFLAKGKQISAPKNFVQWNTDKGRYLLYFDEVVYVQTSCLDSRDKIVKLLDSSEIALKNISFGRLLEILPEAQFCRINKKQVISMNVVSSFSHQEIRSNFKVENGEFRVFSLSEIYKKDFLQKIRL